MKDIKIIPGIIRFDVGVSMKPVWKREVVPGDHREMSRRQDIERKVQRFAYESGKKLREQLDKLLDEPERS